MAISDTDFWKQTNWYAIQTKPWREDQAANNLRRLGLDVFLPKIKHKKIVWGKCKAIIKPLFPNYLFAQFSPSPYLRSVRYARGVNRVVSAGEVPVPLDKEILQVIQSKVGKDGYIRIGSDSLKAGDQVIINEGPLRGLEGIFEQEISDGERAIVLLKTVDYQARVFIEKFRLTAGAEIH